MRLDLHVHSHTSFDSLSHPRMLIDRARAMGLDGIAICDHNNATSGLRVAESNVDPDFVVIPGAEYSTDMGHIQGLFLNRQIPLKMMGVLPWREVVDAIHEQNGIAILAHPFKSYRKVTTEVFLTLDGIEVYNARATFSRFDRPNQRALSLFVQDGDTFSLMATAGSDAHWLSEIGTTYAIYPDPPLRSLEAIRNSILEGPREIIGAGSLPIMEAMSQFVKTIKEQRYRSIPKSIARIGFHSLRTVQCFHRRRAERIIF